MAFDKIVAAYREAQLLVRQIEMCNYVETSCGHSLKNNIHYCRLKDILEDGTTDEVLRP
jgi:hypothetical protein